ncbi:hypothetical protein K1T71_013118 [Dendrolimus kikuchii]|uniref:Uncharacterized protein n=1 Tax=Dendrolimus kikuchii TaxID=765133 RepID=A0ACC1CJ51_9NEOP|nr:hypothetical protein K1T71_013118 [Dendrolimus kikuchii]
MANILPILLFLCCGSAALAYRGPDLPPGPYCGITGQCCTKRQDGCSHRILDSVCYCDQFCKQNRTHDDCCPDYETVCLNEPAQPIPLQNTPCKYNNKRYFPDETTKQNCNTCTCVAESESTSNWQCEQKTCLMDEEIIENVNSRRLSWRAANYSEFYGKTLEDGLTYKLGTLPLSVETKRMGAIRYDKDIDYPREFDARRRWNSTSPIIDQGWCGSDWAVSIVGVASDRFAIQSNGAEKITLSAQMLLSCKRFRRDKGSCKGGHIDIAWNYAKAEGLVDDKCFPYQAKDVRQVRCPFKRNGDLISDGCTPSTPLRTSRYKVGPPGRLKNIEDIMYDIMTSGPVQAVMTVHQDFFHYRDGIYRRSRYGDNYLMGLHSVRVMGWGEERGDKYWIVANSWGTNWGENGFFRIARGENESDIESFVVTVLTEVASAYQKK